MESQASNPSPTTPAAPHEFAPQSTRFARPLLCLVTDRKISRLPLLEALTQALTAGVDWIQLRERDLGARDLCELASDVQALVRACTAPRSHARHARHTAPNSPSETRVRILINRRLDVALATSADGVHLGWNSLAPDAARSLLATGALVGCAAHSLEDVRQAAMAGADYVNLAPIFAPRSKAAQSEPLGLAALTEACRIGIPVIAQGGITPKNTRAVIEAGATGIAVTGEILLSEIPGSVCQALREAIDSATPP